MINDSIYQLKNATVMNVLAFYLKDSHSSIKVDDVYRGFFDLSIKHPEDFSGLHFSNGKKPIHSDKLEDILFVLGAFGILSTEGFLWKNYSMKRPEAIRQDLEKRFGQEYIEKLKLLAKEFSEAIKN